MHRAALAAGFVLLLVVGGLALPVQSQEESEPQRWPYFEAEHRIEPPAGVHDFGHHVATDGVRVLVAARDAAFLYDRVGGDWVLGQRLDPASGDPVLAVALGDDRAVVATAGALHVWKPGAGTSASWTAAQTLTGPATLGEALLAHDGVLFASAPRGDTLGDLGQGGELHVYSLQNGAYVHKQTVAEPTDTVQRVFGTDLATRDGVLVVGAPARVLTEQVAPGAAFVYERQGSTWTLAERLDPSPGDAQNSFGARVATTGDTVVVSASSEYLGTGDGSGWVSFYEKDDGRWTLVQEEDTDASAVAARDDAILTVEWYWSFVSVWMHESEQLRCWRGPWCSVGILGGWNWYYDENPVPTTMALEDRVAVLGIPDGLAESDRSGLVLAYYDNALPRAYAFPDEPVDDVDEDGHEAITLDASPSWDPDGTIESYAWLRDGAVVSTEPFYDVDLPIGRHGFTLEVTDDLGGVGRTNVIVVVQTPQLRLDFDYCCEGYFYGLEPGRNVYFWSDVHDHRAGTKHWDWDFDGDGTTDSTETNPRYRFPHGGDWDVHLTVTNEAGDQLTAQRTLEIANSPPDAHAGPVQVVEVGLAGTGTATLDGSRSSDPDGTVEQFDWLRQDPVAGTYSSTASGETADVQVTRGVNRFQLWAVDDDGDDTAARTVVVAIDPGQNTTGAGPRVDYEVEVVDRAVHLTDASLPGDADIVAVLWGTNESNQFVGFDDVVFEFDDAGEHEVHHTVVDADGRVSHAVHTVTVPDDPPEVYAWPLGGTVAVGDHGVFIARADDEAPDRIQWSWSIDGAVVSDHQDFGHTFTSVGNHAVSVTATDDEGHEARLDGYMEVITEDEFRERFSGLDGEDGAGNGTDGFEGALDDPDDAIREDVDRLRDPDAASDGTEDEADEDEAAPLLSANAPAVPGLGGVPSWIWVLVALGVLVALLLVVEARRQVARRQRRRERYEAAMKARLERRRAARRQG